MRYELADAAERDIRDTAEMFGLRQVEVYSTIIERAFEMIAENPSRPNSSDCSEMYPGVRKLHLQIASGRRGGAAHCVYYLETRLTDDSIGVMILRVLHEHMEPRHRVVKTLSVVDKKKGA
ncbi:type II toxin-antitoxin system RelE/ParE family toxin [Corticibacterium sp. UT-5YL-CI-8]|nr:type II toxin-antitoxin system RelE/ParE family toxin [Tianweitania sp. UT-5YL-CI-8]